MDDIKCRYVCLLCVYLFIICYREVNKWTKDWEMFGSSMSSIFAC